MLRTGWFLFLWTVVGCVFAQSFTPVPAAEVAQARHQLEQAFAFETLQAQFEQTKRSALLTQEVKSTGSIYLNDAHYFRINYLTPTVFSFWTNGEKAYNAQAQQAPHEVPTHNKRFVQMARLFQGGLLNPQLFDLSFSENAQQYCCKAVPKQASLKNMYAFFEIYVPKTTAHLEKLVVASVRKTEVSTFEFKQVKLNEVLSPAVFDPLP